jgi:hypothetical protein
MQDETKQSNLSIVGDTDIHSVRLAAEIQNDGFANATARLILKLQKELDDLRTQTEAAFKNAGLPFKVTNSRVPVEQRPGPTGN